jgi:hypothetical protein
MDVKYEVPPTSTSSISQKDGEKIKMIQVYYFRDYIRGFKFLNTELKTIAEIGTLSG